MMLKAAVVLVGGLAIAAASAAPAGAASGKLAVQISAPRGVPANVMIGPSRVAAKPAKGRKERVILSLKARRHLVRARPFSYGGRYYAGKASKRSVRVSKGKRATVRVRYRRVPSASRLRATKVKASALTLAWKAPKGAKFALRRATGPDAPTSRREGKAVRTNETEGRRA